MNVCERLSAVLCSILLCWPMRGLLFWMWQIRVFTFMVGREVGKVKHIQWMACNYKGRRFFHCHP